MKVDISVLVGGEAGQGIQTVGNMLARTCHAAGLYVMMINDFESRIRGGHSFSQLRISNRPVLGPANKNHLIIALDESTCRMHISDLVDDGLVLAPRQDKDDQAQDTNIHRIDFQGLAKKAGHKILTNTVAAGACLGLLGAPLNIFQTILKKTFADLEEQRIDQNIQAAQYGYDAVTDLRFKPAWTWEIGSPKGRLIDGAQAVAFGALAGDCRFSAFYPMSPATNIIQTLIDWGSDLPLVIEQAEDEIAAINMVIGAAFAGVRAMTATSGGGFALMSEGLGLAAMTETPIVVVNAQRPGPATGLPTRTAQADLQFVIHAAQDEFPRFVFAPGTPYEAYHAIANALDLSQHYQVPAIILIDQYLADSVFVVEETLDVPDSVTTRTVDDSDMNTPEGYLRYALSENGISPRALPCQGRALIKACSDEHDEEGHITEDRHMRDAMVKKRFAKGKAMLDEIRPPAVFHAGARTLLVGWGSMKGVLQEAVMMLRAQGHDCGGVHFTDLWPFPDGAAADILSNAKRFIMVEQNHTAQLGQLIRQQTGLRYTEAVLKTSGRPLRADEVAGALETILT